MADSVLTLVGGTLAETKELILKEIQAMVMDARYQEAYALTEIYRNLGYEEEYYGDEAVH